MLRLLQISENVGSSLDKRLPTFNELIKYYGPYLGFILLLIIVILILQYVWFDRLVRSKNAEINRLAQREQELNDRILHMINEEIGYRKKPTK